MKKGYLYVALAGLGSIFLSGCYYTTQGYYLLSYQAKAKPIHKILSKDGLPESTRDFLLLVEDIRNFAAGELGLEMNKNYSNYLDLDQDVLAWVVSACDPLAFNTYLWNYPVMGKLPYRGYYRIADAKKEGKRIKEKGKDVWVRGVEAFSTLGYFKDPLVSYMASYPVYEIANLIIHEQTHATIWKKGDTSFNEDLAAFVGDEGARLFILSRFGEDSREYLDIDANKENSRRFRDDILQLRKNLETFYGSLPNPLPEDESPFLGQKQRLIKKFQEDFLASYDERYTNDNYRNFGSVSINNAYIDLFHLYNGRREDFEQWYADAGHDMKRFISSMKEKLEDKQA